MSLIIHVGAVRAQWWKEHMQSLLPDIECRLWDEPGDDSDIEYALVWKHPAGGLNRFPNLKCIVSMGAGIDHVLVDPELPKNIPIIRTTGDDLTQRMREYVCLHVLRHHRRLMEIEAAQKTRQWAQAVNPPANERGVGIMGLGRLGSDAAKALVAIGFKVSGWTRTPKSIAGVACYSGEDNLGSFLQQSEILVCLLPLTKSTHGILNKDLFSRLPKGACIINAARGEHLVDEDLLAAFDANLIDYATLDVFHQEPLPDTHPFWEHPRVLITPHVASLIDPVSGGKAIARNLRLFIEGQHVPDLVDLEQGY